MSKLDDFLDATVLLSYPHVGYALRRRHLPAVYERMEGKTVIVTGATSGIGLSASRTLASLGARVSWVGRNEEKLKQVAGSTSDIEVCDLSLLADIRRLSERLLKRYERIDVLINNAGVLPPTRQETPEGHEVCFATNLLGQFLLTQELLPRMAESGNARVINVSSGGMYTQRIHPEDLEFLKSPWRGEVAYARTKRGQVILTEMWAEKWADNGILVNAMHPGWVNTPGVMTQLPRFYRLTRPFLRTPEEGADTVVWLAASKDNEAQVSGKFFLDRRPRPTHKLKGTQESQAERDFLWAELERLSKV